MTILELFAARLKSTLVSPPHPSSDKMKLFLQNKQQFSLNEDRQLREHISKCTECWQTWNKIRWDVSANSQGMKELREFFGDEFEFYHDSSWELVKEWQSRSPSTTQEISDFYKATKNYIYGLVIWHESGDRYNLVPTISGLIREYKLRSVIDFGSGVGTDSITFAKLGLKVYSVDFDCPTAQYMNWVLHKRGFKNIFINTEKVEKFPEADLFWAIDVLEHVPDPLKIIEQISDQTKVFAHISQFNEKHGGRHPFHIDFELKKLHRALRKKGFSFRKKVDNGLEIWTRINTD